MWQFIVLVTTPENMEDIPRFQWSPPYTIHPFFFPCSRNKLQTATSRNHQWRRTIQNRGDRWLTETTWTALLPCPLAWISPRWRHMDPCNRDKALSGTRSRFSQVTSECSKMTYSLSLYIQKHNALSSPFPHDHFPYQPLKSHNSRGNQPLSFPYTYSDFHFHSKKPTHLNPWHSSLLTIPLKKRCLPITSPNRTPFFLTITIASLLIPYPPLSTLHLPILLNNNTCDIEHEMLNDTICARWPALLLPMHDVFA